MRKFKDILAYIAIAAIGAVAFAILGFIVYGIDLFFSSIPKWYLIGMIIILILAVAITIGVIIHKRILIESTNVSVVLMILFFAGISLFGHNIPTKYTSGWRPYVLSIVIVAVIWGGPLVVSQVVESKIEEDKKKALALEIETPTSFCPECGHKLNPEDRFCGSCGTEIKR